MDGFPTPPQIRSRRYTALMKIRILSIVLSLTAVAMLVGAPTTAAQSDNQPVWQAADSMRSTLLDAQRELFAARRSDEPATSHAAAAALVGSALDTYTETLQADIISYVPESNTQVLAMLADAHTVAEAGDDTALALARGRIVTELLHASYVTTLGALRAGDTDAASQWLALREYRQATRVNIVLSPAAGALDALRNGDITTDEALAVVDNDLRDAYYFRLRQAATELQGALETGYSIRAAEWLGQLQGYFAIFADDYAAQTGTTDAIDRMEALADAVLADETDSAIARLDGVRSALTAYTPVKLSDDQVAERGQLLYIFLDLTGLEYKDAVRDGRITIPIEYQEASTFLAQARSTYDELRPTIAAANPAGAERLDQVISQMETTVAAIGEIDTVRTLADEGKRIVGESLPLDLDNNTAATFTIVGALLDDAAASIADGRYGDAESTRLQAYALFDFGPEQRLMAFSPDLAVQIDALFWHGDGDSNGLARVIASRGDASQFNLVRSDLDEALGEAQIILGATTEPITIIVNSAIIVFREGLEAVVIIAALSAGMVRANARYRRPLFAGAFSAFLVTGVTWVIADALLSLFRDYGERLEAVVSLVALGVLLLITNWFFHKMYWTDHLAGFHQRKGRLLRGDAGKVLGLVLLGFTSIYREGFETVLFLQALVLDAGVATVLEGVLLGLFFVAIVGFITFKLQRHLPYMKMMMVTGVLIGAVLVMLVGNTMRVLQVVGWMPIHPIDGVSFPYWWGQWFGVYPTWEGILAQVIAAVFVIGSYLLAERQAAQQRRQRTTKREMQPA